MTDKSTAQPTRGRAWIAGVAAVFLTAGLIQATPAQADVREASDRPSLKRKERVIDGHAVPVRPRKEDPVAKAGRRQPPVDWPVAGTGAARAVSKDREGRGSVRLGTLPISVSEPTTKAHSAWKNGSPAFEARTLPRRTAERAGVAVLFTLARTESTIPAEPR